MVTRTFLICFLDEYPDHYANKLKDEVRGMEDEDSESDDSDFDPGFNRRL